MQPVTEHSHAHLIGKKVFMKAPHPHIGKTGTTVSVKYFPMGGWGIEIEFEGAKWVSFDAEEIQSVETFDNNAVLEQLNLLCTGQLVTLNNTHPKGGHSGAITLVVPGEGEGLFAVHILLENGEVVVVDDFSQFTNIST